MATKKDKEGKEVLKDSKDLEPPKDKKPFARRPTLEKKRSSSSVSQRKYYY